MPSFTYTARDASGKSTTGSLDAGNRREAVRRLQARGLQPVRVDEDGAATVAKTARRAPSATGRAAADKPAPAEKKPADSPFSFGKPKSAAGPAPTRAERLPFLESLADLIRSGMSAGEGVRLLSIRLQHPRLRRLFGEIWTRLGEGQSLSVALGAFPQVFDSQTVNLIAAGEATGNLHDVLDRLIHHLTEQKALKQKLLTAMAYPAFICVFAFGVVLFFLFFLLPRLEALFKALGGELPLITRLLIGSSEFILRYGLPIGIVVTVATLSFWQWRRTTVGRAKSDALLFTLPVFHGYLIRSTVLNFSQTLAVLIENGITTSDALRLTERTIENVALRARLHEATDRVLEGESLSNALKRTDTFPPLVLDRMSVAEQTGNLAPGLRDIARSSRNDLDRWLDVFVKLVSSAVLLFAFTFVALLAVAIVLAVLKVSSSFRF